MVLSYEIYETCLRLVSQILHEMTTSVESMSTIFSDRYYVEEWMCGKFEVGKSSQLGIYIVACFHEPV